MNCTINDINLTFDQNSRLRTTIGRVTGFDIKKAYVLASFLQDQKFKKYLLANITENDVLKDNNVDFKNFTENDYVKLNQNKLGALLNTYYIEHYFSVNNSKTNKGLGNLSGFTSASAKTIAKTHTANLIIDAYYEEFGKANPKKAKDIILAVNEQILTTFFERVARFAEDVSVTGGHSKEAKDYAKKYIELNQSIKELYDKNKEENNNRNFSINDKKTKIAKIESLKKDLKQFKEGDDNYKRILQQIKSLTKEIKQLETESINPILNNIKNRLKEIAILERDKYVMAQNLVNLYCTNTDLAVNERLRNYANLVAQTRGDANGWYFQVFNTKSMTSVIKEFNSLDNIEKYIEEQDENNDDLISRYNGESVDETAKSWEDNLYKSFNQIINGRLKLELSRIPKLKNRFNKNSDTQALDTNNELGVQTYMDTQFVSVQIFTFGNFNSVRSLIDSLEEKSNNIKSLYGLGGVVNRMKKDKVFANFVYANFAKPIVNKTILTINDVANGSFNFEYSNPNAFPITELVFRITNKIRATYNTTYNKKDIIELSNILEEFESGNNTVELKDRLYKIISNYISAFDKEVFNNYFDNNGANIIQRVPNLINSLRDIINGIGYLKDEINKEELEYNKNFKNAREQYQNDYREWLKLPFMQRKETPEPQYPKYEYVDYSSKDLNSTIYKGIFNFAKEIVEFTEARVRLNTTNSEGNSASDVIKNCFVTRFFDQINAESEEDSNAGLKNLLKFVTQGTENGKVNQYSNNPLLFGIKDENGQIVSPGMFTRVGDEFRINANAKEIFKYNLFDGVKNNKENTADSYASMTKLDFFVTQYLSFRDGVTEFTENGKQTKIGKQDNAVYAMRIGSDAPKIFFIRAPKYNYTQLELAFYNHVIGELNTFCKALNNIFVQESDGVFRTTTNIDKLIGRAFYDERTADKIKHDKGTDFTKAIVQDGRLVGNMFAFKRLFDTNGYSASNEIETMLSLYGGGNTEGLIIPDNNGRLSINTSRINNTSQNQSIIWTGEQFELNLSIEQKQILKGIVKQWMNNYVQEITNRTSEFTKVMKENGITTDRAIVHSYLLNSANMNMCYDDLFEGDYKYYTNARDFLKRTKEVQAGGDVYAGYNLLDVNNDVLHDLDWYGTPEYINIKTNKTSEKGQYVVPTHKGNRIENAPMVARNGWRAITIYNTNKASDVADEMQKNLEDNFIKDGMSEEAAHKRSVLIASGYGHNAADIKGETTKINDAQSYITFEEFIRRRHADGTIDQYQDLIAQLLDPNISAEEIDLTDINVRIQVQKNFYFDIRFDANTGLYYPRQIKNAEFVLIPKLLPKDSQLRKVYDFMKKHDIGQLNTAETSKAAKRTIFTIWDQKTGEFNENFEEDFNENYVEDYFYQYLYKQQEVPEHIKDAKNKAGIQITKKIIDNVISRANKNPHLQKWASDYQNAYSINIEESFYEFLDNVGWALDSETGKIVNAVYATTDSQGNELSEETIKANKETLNFNKFYQLAREEAARVGRDSNFMEYLIPNEFGDPEMPNYMSNVMSSLESIAQSIFNSSITRQTFPGWHAAQITGVGYSKKLQFDPKTGVMQVYLPRWSKLIPKGKNAEEDAKILQQIQNEGLDIHLGYRIPTEGKQSISVLRVVGFTNECLGSTIIVPDDWVTQTGSDFDVDSIYGIAYEIYQKKDKKGNITVHKIPFEEGEVNDQDLYIHYINSKLENKIKLKDVSDISGDIKNDIEDIKNELNNTELRGTLSKEFDKLDEQRNELYEKLPSWARGIIKTENEQAKKLEKKDKIVTDLRNVYGKINEKFEEQLNKRTLDDETKEDIQEYMDLQTGLIDVMNRQEGIPGFDKEEYKSKKAESIQAIIEAAKQEWIKTLEEKAKILGLLSFDEFIKLDHLRKLSRRARNNYILDRMIKIMNDPASHEEQYGRSKFDDISNANKLIDKLYGKEDSKTSPYNQLDQLDYFDDALGGARLKALSVNHDRFNSINNKVRAELSDEDTIEVILNVGDKSAEDSDIIYDENIIRENYDNITEYVKPKIESKSVVEKDLPYVMSISMNFDYKDKKRKDIKSTSTIEAIENGERTATTRYDRGGYNTNYLRELDRLKIGDIVEFTNESGKKIYAKITKPLTKLSKNTNAEEWSKKEGWSVDYFNEKVKPEIDKGEAYQFEYEYINNEETITNEKYPIVELKHEKVLREEYGLNIPKISNENKSYLRYYFSNNVIIGDNYYNIQEIFALVDVLYEFEQNLNSDKDVANKMLYKDFISKYPNMGKQLGFIQSALDGQFGFYKEFKYKKGEVVLRKSVFKLLDNIKNINPNLLNDISISEIINENYLIEDLINEINDNVKINDSRQLELNFNKQQTINKKQILFKANRIGWSNNNRNIVGEIVTSYGSQTTAHHLDAVKMGSVPNVNEYTFSVYKLLSSLGLDHEFAIAFIRQPAITSIVNNNNLLESVFFSSRNNPINLTLKEIANRFSNTIPINEDTYYKQKYKKHLNKYGEFDEDTIIKLKLKARTVKKNASLHNTLAALKNNDNFINAFRKLFDIDISNMSVKEIYNIKVPLNKEQLFTRIKREAQNKGNVFENAAFDFAMGLNFKQYKNTANKLEDYINVTAADKFGAKISVRETRLVKETVAKLRDDMTLSKHGLSFIDLIYPIDNHDENQIDIERSSYKSIASVYAYATIPSIQTSSQLFITENDNYADVVSYIEYKIKHKLNDNEYKEYKRYAMNYLYNHISKLLTPLTVNQKGQIIYNIDKIEENEIKLKTANKYWDIERSRILGYGIVTDGDFTPENLNKPTDNDIKQFNELTPAQKVLFMQKHYPDGQGIFNYIKVTLLNPGDIKYKGLSRQYLAVDDQVDNIEDLFQLFINSFSNKNPLIKLAAIDLIKYSFIAEGFNFKSGYINKIIPNSTLYTSDKDGGMDIIKDIKSQINYFYNQLASDEFIDNFVRSHSELIKLDKFAYYESEFESLILKNRKGGGLIYINDKDLIDKLNLKNKADGYVRLSLRMVEDGKTITDISLYKVLKKADDKYFLLPLNTLDKYETHDYSYNANNNKFATLEYYKDLAQKWYTEGKFVRASKFEPIYKYTPDNPYDPKDTFMLMKAYNSGDEITKAGVKKLIDSIEEYLTNTDDLTNHAFVQFNPNFQLKKILPRGSSIIQTISLSNGTDVDVVIQHPKLTTIPSSEDYKQAIQDMNDSKTLLNNADFYRVVRVVDDTKVKKAATELLDNEETFDGLNYSARKDKSFDQVSFDIIKEINYDARKNESSIAERFMKEMDRHNVNRYYGESISKNKENIYKSAARYYKSAANGIINKLNSFTIDHTEYSMDDENMYLALQQHDEYFREVASIILEGITFGNRISGIFQLDIRTEDKETKEAIESIIASINSVRNNKKLKDAMNNIINIYFKKYSTNPDIVNDLITLREQFGDLESIDSWITDPTEIDNNEVQVILKQVYGMFNKAEMFDTKQNVKEWEDALAEIEAMRGELDINKIIDFDNFKVRQDYNEKYLKARQEVIDKCNDAKLKRNNSFEDFVNYVKAKYDRDLFMYEHQHQQIVPEYYKQDLEMRKEAMEKAGDLYYKYLQLTSELYNDNGLESDEEKANRKARIKAELSQLKSETSDTGVSKSEKETLKVKALNNFINSRRKLQEEFFDSQEYEGFKDNYIRYKEFIDDYDEKYKLKTLEEKLENDEYREAYEWIRDNGHIGFSKEMSDKLKQAFKTLSNRTTVLSKKTMTEIKQNPNVLDEFGNVDPRKLTEEQIADIRNDESTDLSLLWDDGLGEAMLIKNVPSNLPVLKRKSLKKAHKDILEELKYEDNVKKFKIIARINEILGKAINKTNGEIEVATLFDDYYVTNEERIELGKLYEELRQLQKANRRIYKKRKNEVYTEEINNTGFTIAMSYYNNNLRNTKQSKQFLDIFTEIDDNGNLVANRLLFGYLMPTEDYIDKEKTDARNFIEENVVFVTTQYYQLAKEEAASKGQEEYDKWFKANHIYNPYLHRYEPLKIWTKLEAKPNSKLAKSVTYIPTFENMEKSVKDKYINNVENRRRLGLSGEGFKKFSNNYKKGDPKFDTNIKLNEKEEKLRNLITATLNKYATTYQGKRFVGQGFLPRERKTEKTTSWALGQLGSLLGISWHSGADSDAFHESVDYSHDKEADMTMLTLIKTKGTQEYKSLPKRIDYNTEEEYLKDLAKIKEENRKITEENLKIDSKNINKDWKEVMKTFIHNATIFNSRQSAKPYLYLLLEDLANNNAYMLRGMFDKRVVKTDSPKDNTMYRTVEQKNTYDVIHNLTRRLLFGQYHENSKPRAIANLLQNMTSAKYMVFNGYGGIANVATGKVNIAMEEAANEYFGYADFHKAETKYLANIVPTIASLYSDKAPNITVGLMKHFHIVNFDQVLEFASGDGVEENLKRVRNWMYSFQSMGEHLMQNSVLLAMLNSNRLYTDSNGVKRIGDFKDYTAEIEKLAMLDVIKGNELLRDNYLIHLERIKNNVEKKLDITTGKQDFNRSFLLNLKNSNEKEVRELYRKTSEAYAKRREELMKQEKEKFYKNPTVESLYELKDGIVQIKPEILAQFNKDGKNAIGSLEKLLGEFKEKVISVNKKIHGVYDKNGAAKLESKWYGSLIMQYHKHLWTGIMKRWRRKGYYSEFRGSKERGSYQTLIDFLGTEFVDFNDTVQNKVKGGEHIALASIQTAMRSILDSFINIQFNWNMLSNWERANIRRNLGEMSGVLVACLVVMALYGIYDDDEIKDDRFKASLLYLADRLYSDTTMYTPIGLITEAKTAWSSPIASGNGPSDLIKAMMMIPQALFDPDFNPNYQTGRYAGENKLWVLFRRNMPAMRPIYAWLDITENTNYYKVGQSQIGINASRRFGELFNE